MPIMRSAAIAAFACLAGSAVAAAPSFDCAKAQSEAETLVCQDPDLAALDVRLAERYAAALKVAEGLDAGAQAAVNELKATQRGWIGGRDDCWKADDQRACVEQAYLTREGELVARYLLEPPSTVAVYTCDDNPSNEVTIAYYDTALPSARIEYGDSVATASLAPSGSGSRYEGAFGLSLWLKGNDLMFESREGEEMNCVTP